MGTFLGHAATGAFLFAYGLWVFLRCQGSRALWAMRTNDTLLCLPPFAMVLGGLIFFGGEFMSVINDGELSMSHYQHITMALWIAGGGLVQLLHMKRFMTSNGFAMFLPATWIVMAVIFFFHPQHSLSLQFGHDALAIMFIGTALAQLIDVWTSSTTNPTHHIHQLAFVAQIDKARKNGTPLPSPSPCPCGCGVSNSSLNPIYNNPYTYGTILPMLAGFLMMVIGSLDCQMAVDIYERHMRGSQKMATVKAMDMDMSEDEVQWMSAEETFLMHLLVTMLVQMVVAIVLRKIDEHFYADSPAVPANNPRWKDDFSLHSPSVSFEKALASLESGTAGRRREVHGLDFDS